jgi:hypothetical protein
MGEDYVTRQVRVAIPLVLGGLELAHPTWSNNSVAEAVAAAGGWWIPLHLGLLLGYALLVLAFWPSATVARVFLAAFAICNTAFLGTDGVVVGVLAGADPAAADALWNSPLVTVLADLTGATRAVAWGLAAYDAYVAGGNQRGLRAGLFILAAIPRQHVGLEAALGMVFLALAGAATLRGRSGPAASSPL